MKILELRLKYPDSTEDIDLANFGETLKDQLYDEDEDNVIDITYEITLVNETMNE
jgi:hypothetical protein